VQAYGSRPERLAEYAHRLEIGPRELEELSRPLRPPERSMRDVLIYLPWRKGRFRLGRIGPHFGVGYAAVSQACRRTERHLETDPKLQLVPTVETAIFWALFILLLARPYPWLYVWGRNIGLIK